MPKEMSSSVRAVKQAQLAIVFAAQVAAVATGNGNSYTPKSSQLSLIVSGITTATIKVEASPDGGTTWVQVGADITANGVTAITGPFPLLRARISAWTAGTINAWFTE